MTLIRISNPGLFDVGSALNMLGASVKTGTNPIGMFGSGTKYALSQACRDKIDVSLSVGQDVYKVGTKKQSFREKEFHNVTLRSKTAATINTPITTEFGSKDWNDVWFIFRELFSNAIDEGNHEIDIVDDIAPIDDKTCVFLPYNKFKHIYDNLEHYFTKHVQGVWAGSGCVYRNGVFIGQFDGCKINMHSEYIKINECRVMDADDARDTLNSWLYHCTDVDVWVAYLTASENFQSKLHIELTDRHYENTVKALHEAFLIVYGPTYCLCPDVNDIVRDVKSMGYIPVVLKGLSVKSKHVKTFASIDESPACRSMNENETVIFNEIRKSISAFIPVQYTPTIKVISSGAAQILGQADWVTNTIYIRGSLFEPMMKKELVNTIIHEFGHIISQKGDYDRGFTNFFIQALTDLSM